MKIKFIKIVTIVTLGAISFLTSCEKESLNNNVTATIDEDAQVQKEVENLINEIKKDKGLIEYDVVVPGSEELRAMDWESAPSDPKPKYFEDVYGYASKTAVTASNQLQVDLNEGAGGFYVYLRFKLTNLPQYGISAIDGYYTQGKETPKYTADQRPFAFIDSYTTGYSDHKGFSTNYKCGKNKNYSHVWLSSRNNKQEAIRAIMVASFDHEYTADEYYGYTKAASKLDLNKGVGGKWIYLFTITHPKPAY